MCREAAELEDALDAELWASALLGSWWPPQPGLLPADADEEFGSPLVEEVARLGGAGALAALLAFGAVSETEAGVLALGYANDLLAAGVAAPAWGQAIMETEILRTAVMRDEVFDDGITIFVEGAHADGERHAIGVYIDHNLGVMAKDLLLADSIDRVEELLAANPQDGGILKVDSIDPGEAGARIHAAMELTDMTLGAPVGEDYARLRALALLRADELPGSSADVAVPELTQAARERLLSDFLASPAGRVFEAGSNEAEVAALAIDFCADYVDGRPLRWSPVVVELFMADWLPRKLLADRAMFEAVPGTLEAWVRYAGVARAIPDAAIEQTVAAIGEWTADMLEQLDDDRAASPAMDFLTAAQDAGIDLADKHALAGFIAGWNARSAAG